MVLCREEPQQTNFFLFPIQNFIDRNARRAGDINDFVFLVSSEFRWRLKTLLMRLTIYQSPSKACVIVRKAQGRIFRVGVYVNLGLKVNLGFNFLCRRARIRAKILLSFILI